MLSNEKKVKETRISPYAKMTFEVSGNPQLVDAIRERFLRLFDIEVTHYYEKLPPEDKYHKKPQSNCSGS